jgi:hypothetical protein
MMRPTILTVRLMFPVISLSSFPFLF